MPVAVLVAAVLSGAAYAYNQYNDGCVSCHGAFTDGTSPKGTTFPGNSKHTMHRSSQYMNTACALCHRSDDSNNPFIGSSDGTANNPGLGCVGCHEAAGLRLHHANTGTGVCVECHTSDPTPSPENLKPTYYGTPDTNAANPCNPTGQTNLNENWSVNCCFGLDGDGDNLYDMADPDCAGPSSTPGEAGATAPVLVTGYNKTTGALTISYGTGCSATNNNVEYGPLSSVSTYGYSGQVCNIGNTGTATFTLPSSSTFFLLPGHDATKEGSYGKKRTGGTLTERPEDTTSASCPFPQDLTLRCD